MHPQIGADQRRRNMKNLILAGALLAVLVSPAFAQRGGGDNPRDPNDPYNTNAEHLDAQSQEKAQGLDVQTSPQAGTTDWDWGQSTTGRNVEPNRRVIQDERERRER
jgi:hypothetical protein